MPSANGTDFLYLTATRLTGNQCQVRYGLGTLPAKAVRITGPGGKCLDVDTNTNANGNAAQLWDCGVATGQRWSRHPEGSLRAFGKCLDVDAQGTANHTEVQLWECNGSGAQKWTHRSDGSLFNPQSGRCLDAPQGATANGTKLQIYDCNGLFPQQWTIPA
ncbi:ricin-type beta-trefoil lectin domain protein [Nonomuraea thailandensis]